MEATSSETPQKRRRANLYYTSGASGPLKANLRVPIPVHQKAVEVGNENNLSIHDTLLYFCWEGYKTLTAYREDLASQEPLELFEAAKKAVSIYESEKRGETSGTTLGVCFVGRGDRINPTIFCAADFYDLQAFFAERQTPLKTKGSNEVILPCIWLGYLVVSGQMEEQHYESKRLEGPTNWLASQQFLKTYKDDYGNLAFSLVEQEMEAIGNPLQRYLQLHHLGEIVKAAQNLLFPIAAQDLQEHPKSEFSIEGCVLKYSTGNTTYDYSEDGVWQEIKAQEKAVAEKRKAREQVLKSLFLAQDKKIGVVDKESGEEAVLPKQKTGNKAIKVTVPKSNPN